MSDKSDKNRNDSEYFDINEVDAYTISLKDFYKNYINDEESISTGDLVEWKDGLKNRKKPLYGQPAIVIEVLDEFIYDNNVDSGSPYYKEELKLVLGILDNDNDLQRFYYELKRFKKYSKERKEICQ